MACFTILSIFLYAWKTVYKKNGEEKLYVDGGICTLVFPWGYLASLHIGDWVPQRRAPGSSVGSHTALLPLHSFVESLRPTHPQWEENQTLPFNGKAT